MKKFKYNANTPVAVILAAFKKKAAAATNCDSKARVQKSLDWDAKFEGQNLGEMADAALTDPEFDQSWELWYLYFFGADTEVECRKKGLLLIKDPMMAFQVYLTYDWLTDEEDKLLEEKFKGKLPTAEAELRDGIVKRAKWK